MNRRRQPAPSPQRPRPLNTTGTGAHGLEWRDWEALGGCPPLPTWSTASTPTTGLSRPTSPPPGNRPHGIGWEGRFLWVTDSNLNAFDKHDSETGAIVERIQLADSDPLPHGMTILAGQAMVLRRCRHLSAEWTCEARSLPPTWPASSRETLSRELINSRFPTTAGEATTSPPQRELP